MRRRRADRRPRLASPGALRLRRALAVLLRALAVLLALQLSGAAHAVHDALELAVAQAAPEHHDCDDAGDDTDCPPGSTGCHRAHHNVIPSATSRELLDALLPVPASELAGLGYDAHAPPRPDPASLDRPPKPLRVC